MAADNNIGEMLVSVRADLAELNKDVKKLRTHLDREGKEMGSSFSNMLKKGIQLAGGLFTLKAAVDFGRKLITTASEFEQLRTRLVSLYGDADKAQLVFKKFQAIAATTPFSLKGVVTAGVTLKAFGLDAENTLKSVTDLAAFMGVDVTEAANAVGRAFAGGAGAADVLRERGVLNLIKSFKGIEDISRLTLPEFRKALIEAMEDPAMGIAGSTDRLSKTFSGAFSNMMDSVENFAASLGGGALSGLNNLARQLTSFISWITPTVTALDEARDKAFLLGSEFESLSGTYIQLREKTRLNTEETKIYDGVISDLQKKYPNYLKSVDLHRDSIDKVKTAFHEARLELDKYIASLITQALITEKQDEIVGLSKRLFELGQILPGLRQDMEAVNKTGIDPFGKMSAAQRNRLLEAGTVQQQLKVEYRTSNIFTPLDAQIKNVEKGIKTLEAQRDRIQTTVKGMTEAFNGATPPINAIVVAEDKIGGNANNKLSLLRQELEIYTELYYGSKKWLDKSKEVLKAQTEELVTSGVKRDDALALEKKQIEDLDKTYNKLSITLQYLDKLKSAPTTQKSAAPTDKPESPGEPSTDLQSIFDMYREQAESAFNWADAVTAAAEMSRGAMQGFFSDIYLQGEQYNSMLEKAWQGMANAFISQVERMITKWLAFQAIKAGLSLIPGGGALMAILEGPGGSEGGRFRGTSHGVMKLSEGKSFRVPNGYPRDSYPMFVESGEDVSVTSANQVARSDLAIEGLGRKLDVLNSNLLDSYVRQKNRSSDKIGIVGEIDNDVIYLSNEKAARRRSLFEG